MTEVTRKPPAVSSSLAVLSAGVSLAAVALGAATALPASVLGCVLVGAGVALPSRRAATLGGAALFVGVVAAGVLGGGPAPVVLGLVGAVVAWDVAEHAVGVGEQLGRETDTTRVELVHAAASLLVGVVAAGVAYAAYALAAGGRPATALVLLLFGSVAILTALRRGPG